MTDIELIGGAEHREIRLVPPDPSWDASFAIHRARISDALGGRALRIDHVGSTAVAGLWAKPIIDIQVSVSYPEAEGEYVPLLERAGYVLRVRESAHRMLRTPELDVHVHVCGAASDWERRHLLFRDWLRVDATDRARYAATKRGLAARDWPTMNDYAAAKSDVIFEVMRRAEVWASETEWRPSGVSSA